MFKPVNRYIQIQLPEKAPQTTSSIVLPEDFKPSEERYSTATVVAYARDVRFSEQLLDGLRIVVDKSMIEEISVNNEKINIVLDNYVVGIVD